jgi:hypothetical protein
MRCLELAHNHKGFSGIFVPLKEIKRFGGSSIAGVAFELNGLFTIPIFDPVVRVEVGSLADVDFEIVEALRLGLDVPFAKDCSGLAMLAQDRRKGWLVETDRRPVVQNSIDMAVDTGQDVRPGRGTNRVRHIAVFK